MGVIDQIKEAFQLIESFFEKEIHKQLKAFQKLRSLFDKADAAIFPCAKSKFGEEIKKVSAKRTSLDFVCKLNQVKEKIGITAEELVSVWKSLLSSAKRKQKANRAYFVPAFFEDSQMVSDCDKPMLVGQLPIKKSYKYRKNRFGNYLKRIKRVTI